jgi:hypothetical protein
MNCTNKGPLRGIFDARWTFVPATEHRFLNIRVFCNKRFHLQSSQKHPVIASGAKQSHKKFPGKLT